MIKTSTNVDELKQNDSYIFSLKSGNTESSILSRVTDPELAITYQNDQVQDNFGLGLFSFHLHSRNQNFTLDNNTCCHDDMTYENQNTYQLIIVMYLRLLENLRRFFVLHFVNIYFLHDKTWVVI